jgi:hypothetical protein
MYECSMVYFGETGHIIKTSLNERALYKWLYHPYKLVVAVHSFEVEYQINFSDTVVWARMTGYMDCLIKEATNTWLYPDNFNRNMGFIQCFMLFLDLCDMYLFTFRDIKADTCN